MIHLTELGYGQPDDPEGAPSPRVRKLLDEKRELEAKREAKAAHVAQADKVLAAMSEQEQDTLTAIYCVKIPRGVAIARLGRRLHISESTVRRINRRALRNFAEGMGYVDK